jgi:ABC-type multidrug transport system ATPase subunit/peptidoglycan/LPS O-acetylase OafA/YrhL
MSNTERLHSLDAVRAGALLLGIVFHAGFSFIPGFPPGIWAIGDSSTSSAISGMLFVAHIFRMSLFFFIAGFFGRMLLQRRGVAGFWANRGRRIALPLVAGWPIMSLLLGAIWVWGLTITFGGTLPAAPEAAPPKPFGAVQLTHLWFLYYLLLLYVLLLGGRGVIRLADRNGHVARGLDSAVRRLVRSGAAVFLLGLPTVALLYTQPYWMNWFGIPTPDQSIIPQAVSLVAYGSAMAFGWMIHRQVELLENLSRRWWAHALLAAVATAACLYMAGIIPTFVPPTGQRKLIYALSYCVAIWAWVFALTGAAVRYLSHESPALRYIADSSYWLYIAHLPVVVALQIVVARWPLHWSLKFPLILAVSLTVLLLSYHWLVRFTWLGKVLNGKRAVRTGKTGRTDATGRLDHPPIAPLSPVALPLAQLRGVHKRYGKQVALDGFDLAVHSGELLAVLGPNGAGKTTAIALCLGLIEADEGRVQLSGREPGDVGARREVGMMMQDVALDPTLRVRELIELASSYYPSPMSVPETLALTGTAALSERLYDKLSGGQKRQVQFALAVAGRPRLLFLDEPTVGLDIEARQTMWAVIRSLIAQGCSIVLTTHYLEEAEALADRIAVVANGRLIASGTVDEVRSLVVRKRIRCATTLDAAEVRSWPGVVEVSYEAALMLITATDAEAIVRRLLAQDSALRNLEVRQAGLAEAFTQLTKEAA